MPWGRAIWGVAGRNTALRVPPVRRREDYRAALLDAVPMTSLAAIPAGIGNRARKVTPSFVASKREMVSFAGS